MSPQLRLPGLDPPKQIRPEAGRKTPVFWVKRIRVVRELKPGDDVIVRDVTLRPGLNVVWAPALLTEANGSSRTASLGTPLERRCFAG